MSEEKKLTPKEALEDPKNFQCTCRFDKCPLFGKCAECIAVHKYFQVLPGCLENATEKMA